MNTLICNYPSQDCIVECACVVHFMKIDLFPYFDYEKCERKNQMKYPQEKLKGIANHYELHIHMGGSKKHHVNNF